MIRINTILLIFLLTACSSKEPKEEAQQQTAPINDYPDLVLTRTNGTTYNARDLEENQILILYLPDCDHCQREAKAISESAASFSRYTVHFFTASNQQGIEQFAADAGVQALGKVELSTTTSDAILQTFGSVQTPTLFIYRDKKLIKKLEGETPVSTIISYLQ